jgi:hypothetical protein
VLPISSPTSRCRGGEIAAGGGAVLIDEEGRVTAIRLPKLLIRAE